MGKSVVTESKKAYKKHSKIKDIWKRLKKNKLAIAGIIIMAVVIVSTIAATFIFDYQEDVLKHNMQRQNEPPSAEHWFGTDCYGRDLFARVMCGGKTSLLIGFIVVFFDVLIGGTIGAVSGYYGGKVDYFIMRFMDIWLAIPEMLLSIAIVSAWGPGFKNLIIALVVAAIPKYARLVRSSVLTIKGAEYIEASKAVGANDSHIILQHVIPNALPALIVQSTLELGVVILSASGLTFLGLGITPPAPEWGVILSEGKDFIRESPYAVLFPGIAIMLVVTSLNFIGDGLRDALDPKLKN